MEKFSSILTMFDMIGLMLSMSSVAIVGHSASGMVGRVRQGLLALIWGLSIVGISFLWSLFSKGLGIINLPDLQSVILATGMAFFLFSTKKLFTIYHEEREIKI
jgi:xanthine/uracil/vitamin C permease (AzgA family)